MAYKVETEQWRHKNAFESYLLLGPGRSFAELAKVTGIPWRTLSLWAKSFGWEQRCVTRDNKAIARIEQENDKVLAEVIMRRHQQAYQAVQEKALNFIKKTNTSFGNSKSPMRDAAYALDLGVQGERKTLGLNDSKLKAAVVKNGIAAMIELVMKE